jgi:hypothetical protein
MGNDCCPGFPIGALVCQSTALRCHMSMSSNYVFFPPSNPAAFFALLGKIRSGEVEGRQIDWGCWAAKMSREKIIGFVDEVYAGSPYLREQPATDSDLVWRKRLQELTAFVHGLPDEEFAVIAIEAG